MRFAGLQREKLSRISPAFFRTNRIVPLSVRAGVLEIACTNGAAPEAADNLCALMNLGCRLTAVDDARLEKELDSFFYALASGGSASADPPAAAKNSDASSRLVDLARTEPVLKAVNELFFEAVNARASDIHIRPEESGGAAVRLRVDGQLCDLRRVPAEIYSGMISRIKIMSGLDIAISRLPQDGSMRINLMGRDIDVRVSIVPAAAGEDAVLRVLDRDSFLLDLDSTGLAGAELERTRRILSLSRGMFAVTGPTGSGKTTTLYACVRELVGRGLNIVTVEDPIEYRIEGVTQMEVKAGLGFASGLRSILRHDPDVIMVGEIRDPETARTAIQAAMTGHLVLASLHTADSAAVPERLYDLGVEPYLVASCLSGALTQRLVRVFCPDCEGSGCELCRGAGFKGRTGVFEVFESDAQVRKLLSARAPADELRDFFGRAGVNSLARSAQLCAECGKTSAEEALSAAG